jgi:hypothetical protein
MSYTLRFRDHPVFTYKSMLFPEELKEPIVSSVLYTNETLVRDVHRCYEEIVREITAIEVLRDSYVFFMDRMNRSSDEDHEQVCGAISSCGRFLHFFFTNHTQLTDMRSWSGSDLPRLHYVFRVLVIHFSRLRQWLDGYVKDVHKVGA